MNGRSLSIALLVLAVLLLFIPIFVVACAYLFTEDGISWHTVYALVGGIVLLAVLIISWRRVRPS